MQYHRHVTLPEPPVNGHRLEPSAAPPLVALDLHLVVESLGPVDDALDVVQEWGEQSFPASDPPANW